MNSVTASMFVGIYQQARRRVAQRTVQAWPVLVAKFHSRRFRIDDTGHGDWDVTIAEREHRTIRIRYSSVPESMVDALYGLRAVERQFGRIRDYRLLRDSEIRSEYQAICWAAFESPKSLLRVPPQGMTLSVVLPPPLGRPDGGLGLDDLKHLLTSEDRNEPKISSYSDEAVTPVRTVVLTIKRTGTEIAYRSTARPPYRSRAMKAAIGHGFLEWQGFSPLKPLHESSPFTSPARDLPLLDSKNMRIALNKWSQILGVADPLFPEMKHPPRDADPGRQNDLSEDWEPLSEPFRIPDVEADSAEELETPQGTQESLKQSLESLLQRSQVHAATESGDYTAGNAPIQEEKT